MWWREVSATVAKLRLFFAKEGRAVYISHLDLLRTFQRVFLREGLVLKHSQGFHPHPILSFAMPLPVCQSSVCEILDFEVDQPVDTETLPERLDQFMPEGIRALRCAPPELPVRELKKLHCKVEFLYDDGVPSGASEALRALFSREALVIQKRTKRKTLADVDIRPMIFSLEIHEEEGSLTMDAVVAAQDPGLNPALLGKAVETYLPELTPNFVRVHRLQVLDGEDKPFC